MQEELDRLQGKRTEIAGNIRTAKGYGDLRENFEYHEAKREQGFLEGRIIELKAIIPAAHVVAPSDVSTEAIGFGTQVRVKDLEYDEEIEYVLVGPIEANTDEDRISYESPIGQALLGRRVGDIVEFQIPAGTARYEVLEITVWEG